MTLIMPISQTMDRRFDRRAMDRTFGSAAAFQSASAPVRVLPGEHYVTDDMDEAIITVLGSCVAACIRDPIAGVGGMNHFMLPQSERGQWGSSNASLRYGNFAMERLINDLLVRGAKRENLEIKVFGGANVLNNGSMIGWKNADFVEEYLGEEGLPIAASHLRGANPRRIHYFVSTGKVQMLELRRSDEITLVASEEHYEQRLAVPAIEGSIELFDDEPAQSAHVFNTTRSNRFNQVAARV
jgi:chemotaxis protein CheD